MQSCASNNGSLSKDAPYLNALPTRNFKCQFDSRYFTPIYKVKTGSVKKNVKLLFLVVKFFEECLAYLKIAFHFVSGTCSPLKIRFFPIFERRKIVQKHLKTSYFCAAIVDIAFLMKSPLFKTLTGTWESQEIEFYQCSAGKLGPFLFYSRPFKLHSYSNFAASVFINK